MVFYQRDFFPSMFVSNGVKQCPQGRVELDFNNPRVNGHGDAVNRGDVVAVTPNIAETMR